MNFGPEILLIVSVGVVGVLHTIVPDHWVPITLLARQRGWSRAETARAALQAGIGHVLQPWSLRRSSGSQVPQSPRASVISSTRPPASRWSSSADGSPWPHGVTCIEDLDTGIFTVMAIVTATIFLSRPNMRPTVRPTMSMARSYSGSTPAMGWLSYPSTRMARRRGSACLARRQIG